VTQPVRQAYASRPHNTPRVLVVDDDTKLAGILVRALERAGYECIDAQSGDQALWAVMSGQPDALVLDVMIPHPSGVEVCRYLRGQGWKGGIVMISARSNPDDRATASRAGADVFLAKPFGLTELVAAVQSLVGGAND
jgi:DNA-binding response OmpR family regulator